jgi:hypothetical protein
MKAILVCILFLLCSLITKAQDTIFMKSGTVIPAVILEKGDVEIKYKKFTQPESAGIYTVFKSDVASLHYKNGTIVNLSSSNSNQSTEKKPAGPRMRFNIGVSGTYFQRNESDNLRLFWRNLNQDNSLELGGNKQFYTLNLGMGAPLDVNKRNWFGAALQLTLTPADAISATNKNNASNEIELRTFYYDICMYYGHTLNHKKSLILIFEPALDLGMMFGAIKANDISYKESGMAGSCHFALGIDWMISKRILASVRGGERFMKINETHESTVSKTGYSSFYANKNINDDTVNVNWGGSYFSFGLSYLLYTRIKTGRPE